MRLVCDDQGQIWPDPLAKAPGRGAYLCMRPECLQRLRDKHLAAAWRQSRPRLPQRDVLLQRIEVALAALCRQYLGRLRAGAAIGHEAVRKRLQEADDVMIVLAADAGAAVRRDIMGLAEQRRAAGVKAWICPFPSKAEMARSFGRQHLAVAAVARNTLAQRLERFCSWHAQLKKSR